MDALWLSRVQFGLTAGFHFIYPSITIGLAWIIFWWLTKYNTTGDEAYRRIAKFWVRIFAVSFVVGVATGITMEFQFGTNWSQYSRFVGDIFGAPLAAEGVFAFFLESSFLAVLVFGWNKVSARVHWFASLMVAVGATLSAFWILVANSWQQTPAGYHLANNRAELTSFWAAVFNPSTVPRFLHTVDACLVTGAFFVLGIGAWYLLKGIHADAAKRFVRVGLVMALVCSVLQLGLGHFHAVQVAHTQPEKLAAIEGLFETQTWAPVLLFGIPDEENETVRAAIRIPGLLSLMAFGRLDAEVKGLKAFPKDERPPLTLTFYPFHLMVALGMYFIFLPALGLLLLWKKKLYESRIFMALAVATIPLPIVANELGWITAEVGRQPWIVYRLLRTSQAFSPTVTAAEVLFSIAMFSLIYILLFITWIYLVRKEIRRGPVDIPALSPKEAQG